MEKQEEKIEQLVSKIIREMDYVYVGLELRAHQQHALLRVYIDNPNGFITPDDCAKISHEIGDAIDRQEGLITTGYTLEVSSAGIDRPLFTLDHFKQFVGEMVQIRLHEKIDNRRNIEGIIEGVSNDRVLLSVDGARKTILFSLIKKANLLRDIHL